MVVELTVRPVNPADLDAAAALFAARHRRDRERIPHLEPRFEDAAGARELIRPLFENPRARGAIAESGGAVAGFLFGEEMLFAPTDMASLFVPPHSISMPIEGHAVVEEQDATAVYRALYGFLACGWVANGFFIHRCAIPPGDAAMQEAWVSLGFGRYLTAATRPTSPVERRKAAAIEVQRASPEDIDVVVELAECLNRWHWQAPMFWPVLHSTDGATREFNLGQLRSGDLPYFVGYQDGTPAGMQTFLRPGFTPPVVARDGNVYLFEGVVSDDVRGGGVGTELLLHSMDWARNAGYETCTLHFASPNPSGAPFWLGHGFVPVEHTMERRVDARVAWAR
ncbi:MAG: GNAT family N-acetyltransferase [Dehalococcoidia bacterium]|nr:GNAT family N-acetyltransferase [Dehalococcoidia bacterium]